MRIEHWLEINECFYAMNRLTIFMHISMVGILELNFLYSLPFVEHGAGCWERTAVTCSQPQCEMQK